MMTYAMFLRNERQSGKPIIVEVEESMFRMKSFNRAQWSFKACGGLEGY
jgi:hypothetical protein